MSGFFRRITRIVSPSSAGDSRQDEVTEFKPPINSGGGFFSPAIFYANQTVNTLEYHDHSKCVGNNRYAQCAEVWDILSNKWEPFDPKDISSKTKKDGWNYFCVTSRYPDKSRMHEPRLLLTHIAEPLRPFAIQICGSYGTWGVNNNQLHEIEIGQAFRALKGMKKVLQSVKDALKAGTSMKAEEKVALAKSCGNMTVDNQTMETELKEYFEELKKQLKVLVDYLDEKSKPIMERLAKAIRYGYMEFDLLPYYFEPGQRVLIMERNLAMVVTAVNVDPGVSPITTPSWGPGAQGYPNGHIAGPPGTTPTGPSVTVEGYSYEWDGHGFNAYSTTERCGYFTGSKEISHLPTQLLTSEKHKALAARGRKYKEQAGIFYRVCHDDRIVIDRLGYFDAQARDSRRKKRIHQNDNRGYDEDYIPPAGPQFGSNAPPAPVNIPFPESSRTDNIDEESLCFLPTKVYGYNLTKRDWEVFPVEVVKPVEFDSKAWDHLVLAPDVKTLIKGLVEVTTKSTSASGAVVNDVIARKGGGLTSVLYGPPGTGKTLTAEAIAELLQRPLLSVGSSDLPRETSQMEDKLRYVLNLATSWDAILLIDEADVFLEQRSMHEIERNALVSAALRALEYHRGVVFLTTNRIKVFDEAFLSRFSIAVKYPELDKAGRYLVWSRFFELAGYQIVSSPFFTNEDLNDKIIPRESIEELAVKNFNGRTIKNLVRTAQALALSLNSPLKMEHINIVVGAQEKFLEDFAVERVGSE